MVLPHLRLILPFSSRYLTTAIDNSLTDMCGPGLGNHERLRGRAGGLKGPAHYGNSLGFRLSFRLTGAASCLPTTGARTSLSLSLSAQPLAKLGPKVFRSVPINMWARCW